jgi:arylsulfatase A-like enzyme
LNYFRCITAIDDNVGKLLKALDDLGLTENTLVIFTSDNGYYLGEHSLGDKRSAYEESIRVPLLVRCPPLPKGRPGGKAPAGTLMDSMVLNIDIAPTFLDFAGVPIPKTMQGRSLKPLIEGTGTDWRKAFFYCYFYERNFAIPTVTAVRTEDAVLIRYPGHVEWTELFDLTKDPYQIKNLIQDPNSAELRRRLEAEYDRQARAIDFRIPEFADVPPKKDFP